MTVNGSTADGYFKTVYGDITDVIPESAIIGRMTSFKKGEAGLGNQYEMNVRLQRPHGVTWSSGTSRLDAFTLNGAASGQRANLQVQGASLVLEEEFGYMAIDAAVSKGQKAFGNLFKDEVEDMVLSSTMYRELMFLYGQTSIGTIVANGSSSTSLAHNITSATSASGIWAQMEGGKVDVYDTTLTTKRNSNGALTVSFWDYDASNNRCTVTLDGAAADNAAVQATDVIVPFGAQGNWAAGLDKICTNTGTLFNISAATYGQWKANSVSAGSAAATFAVITQAGIAIMNRCGMMDVDVLISTSTWADLNNNTVALRRLTENTGKVQLGTRKIEYYGAAGLMRIIPHPMVKAGEAFVGSLSKNFKRVGITDLSWGVGSGVGQNDRMLYEISGKAGLGCRLIWDQAPFAKKPRGWTKITDVVNSY